MHVDLEVTSKRTVSNLLSPLQMTSTYLELDKVKWGSKSQAELQNLV